VVHLYLDFYQNLRQIQIGCALRQAWRKSIAILCALVQQRKR
jgi:hypothetical protein